MADSTHPNHDADQWPEWGSMAVDHFLLDNWDENDRTPDQHQRLMLEYARIGCERRALYTESVLDSQLRPSTDQIKTILEPARSCTLRAVVEGMNALPNRRFVWLRTDYSSEEKHRALIDMITNDIAFGENLLNDGIVLSDARYYNFGDDWTQIHSVLPELTGDLPWNEGTTQDLAQEYLDWEEEFHEIQKQMTNGRGV